MPDPDPVLRLLWRHSLPSPEGGAARRGPKQKVTVDIYTARPGIVIGKSGSEVDALRKEIGAIAKPRQIMIVPELPKTRSGKIMRRLLKDVAEHREVGDVTTLADSTVMDLIKEKEDSGKSDED